MLLIAWTLACTKPTPSETGGEDSAPDCGIERCDGLDNDCDGAVDELFDLDEDGWLADEPECRLMTSTLDCDDLDPSIHPEALELCDGLDNDCSGRIDDAADSDSDGADDCEDCDPADPARFPGAAEACDDVDNDCDVSVDEDWDSDGDGVASCSGDCDDDDPERSPEVPEVCDGVDNDCDGAADEGFDEDADGYSVCQADCDDDEAEVHPGAEEICDGVDSDCDGVINDDLDLDEDGYSICEADCDDGDPFRAPGFEERCDGLDNDCSGVVDELPECYDCEASEDWLYCTAGRSWGQARTACEALGLDLVVIDDAEENEAIVAARPANGSRWWIGLSDAEEEEVFSWVDGSGLDYSGWGEGEPAALSGCVQMAVAPEGVEWIVVDCGVFGAFVCE